MLRVCSYNVEHFNRLFTQTDQMQGNAAEQTRFDLYGSHSALDDRCRHHRCRRGLEHDGRTAPRAP